MTIHSRKAGALLAAAALATGLAACGSGDKKDSEPQTTTATPSSAATHADALAGLYKGTVGKPPTSGPAAVKGKTVLIISCGQNTPSCASGAKGAMDAATAIGWKAKLFDGKFNPALYGTGVQQAVSTKVDGIILDAIDCVTAKPQLEQARKAGIKIVAIASYDCNDPSIGGAPLFDGQPFFAGGLKDNRAAAFAWSAMQAKFAAARQNGKAKVVLFKLDAFLAGKYMREGLKRGFKSCSGCKIVDEVPLAPTDIGPKLQQKVQSALLQHPDANTVMPGFDVLLLAGVGAGVKASGRAGGVKLFGAEGYAPTADLARQGAVAGGVAVPADWQGWAAVDTLNRIFAGQEPVDEGLGFQAWDKAHNLGASGGYQPKVDYQAAYKKVWSAG
jgi:ribose transport system substrate-binding protein